METRCNYDGRKLLSSFGNAVPVEGNGNAKSATVSSLTGWKFGNAVPVEGNGNEAWCDCISIDIIKFGNAVPVEGNGNIKSITFCLNSSLVRKCRPG